MRERPILFSGPMVRAILDGRKVQTRRVINHRHVGFIGGRGQEDDPAAWGFGDERGCWHVLDQSAPPWFGDGVTGESYRIESPYGAPGDRLWVRETWAERPDGDGVIYRATDPGWDDGATGLRWRPSIFMRRDSSRLTLAVDAVRVERLQDISEEDARAEGIQGWTKDGSLYKWAPADHEGDWTCWPWVDTPRTARAAFERLWSEINGADSWHANPWVWVITFRRVAGEG